MLFFPSIVRKVKYGLFKCWCVMRCTGPYTSKSCVEIKYHTLSKAVQGLRLPFGRSKATSSRFPLRNMLGLQTYHGFITRNDTICMDY
jgi:hypothetical protein